MPNVSNGDFLRVVFGADGMRAHVCGFSCDPADAAEQWRGGHAERRLNTLLPNTNNYYAVSVFSGHFRRKGDFAALHVIVFDDVGAGPSAKVPPERILAQGLQPSYRIETSQGNEQWGFILAVPETDLARAEAAIDGFIKSGLTADGKDPGQNGVTRYVRLPVGRNTKARYGPGGFSCRLTEWAPARRYRLDAICAAWGIDLAGATLGAAVRRQPRPDAGENDLLAAMEHLGLVLWEDRSSGTVHIRCPFVDEHTGGGETGTAYLSDGGIKCHHGHCQDRKTPDFIARIKEMLAEQGDGGFMARRAFERARLERYNGLVSAVSGPLGGLQDWLATGAYLSMDSDEIEHAVEGAALFAPAGVVVDKADALRLIYDARRQAQPVSRDEALAQMAAAEAEAVARMPLGAAAVTAPDAATHKDGPRTGTRGPVGIGKTQLIIGTAGAVLAADPTARIAYFAPDHALAQEAVRRLATELGPGVPVEVWRGQEQPDPGAPGETMCRRLTEADAMRQAGGELADLCGSRACGYCPFHPKRPGVVQPCGYQAQAAAVRAARVVVLVHASLAHAPPWPLQRHIVEADGAKATTAPADWVVIDEDPTGALLRGLDGKAKTVPLADLDPARFAGIPDRPDDFAAGWAAKKAGDVLGKLMRAVEAVGVGGRLTHAALKAAGLADDYEVSKARQYVLRLKQDVGSAAQAHTPTGDRKADAKALSAALAGVHNANRHVLDVAQALDNAAGILSGRYGPAALGVEERAGRLVLRLRWREDIHPLWLAAPLGVRLLDATMQPGIARAMIPGLEVTTRPPVKTPHMRIAQVSDRSLGYSSLIEAKKQGESAKRAAGNNTARVLRIAQRLADRHAGPGASGGPGVLAIVPKALEPQLEALPNVGVLHFGKLRGQDAYRDVAAALIVSRPMPPPGAVEDRAEIIFGVEVARLPAGDFYPKVAVRRLLADDTAEMAEAHRHPDPHAEAVRRSICEAELTQAVGRVRGVWRTAANPVDVFILTDVPLTETRPHRTLTLAEAWREWGGLDPVTAFLEAGLLPADWTGRGAILAGAGLLPRAKNPGHAAKRMFQNNADFGRGLAAVLAGGERANPAQTSIDSSYGGLGRIRAGQQPDGGPRWTAHRYRRRGERKAHTVHVADFHADPKAAAAAVFGELDVFEPITTPRRPATPARTPAAVAIGAAPPADLPAPMPAATALPADLPAPDVPVRLPAVIRAAGRSMRDWRRYLLTAQARRLDKDLTARRVRPELIRAFVAKAWIGPDAFAAALRQAQRATA